MKRITTILVSLLLVMTGCGGGKSDKQSEELITVDVTAKYPKKDFILQDFLDVEYIPLETNDEFLTDAIPLAIGEKIIVVRNRSKEIFVFGRDGKAIQKINRHGESGEEYMYNYNVFLDEKKGEIFVCDRKILVYDLQGNFKRSFDKKEDASLQDLTDFNDESFIWWNSAFNFAFEDHTGVEMPSFFITSKQDGSTLKEIEIPMEGRKSPIIIWREGEMIYSMGPGNKTIIPYKGDMILTEASSDTVYRYTRDHRLIPFMARTPSIHSMDPEAFLLPGVITDEYCFVDISIKKRGTEGTALVCDRQTGEIFQYAVYNADYTNQEKVNMYSMGKNGNPNIAFCQPISIEKLLDAYEDGRLQGRLKEIAGELEEDSNPVMMIAKHKK